MFFARALAIVFVAGVMKPLLEITERTRSERMNPGTGHRSPAEGAMREGVVG